MFHLLSGLLAVYVIGRAVLPLALRRPARLWLALLVLAVSQHHLVTRTFFGSMASPEIPRIALIVLGWGFGTIILLAALLLCGDLAALAWRLATRRPWPAWRESRATRMLLAAAGALLSAVGVSQAVGTPDVRMLTVPVAGLPAAFEGYRIVQLTDLHASRLLPGPWMARVVDEANALAPDLTVITGDLVDGRAQVRAEDVRPLQRLRADQGVYAVTGNHEYYSGYTGWMEAFDALGLHVLSNAHVVLERGGQPLVLAGITDRIAVDMQQSPPDLAAALKGAPAGAPVILLSHRPTGARAHAQAGVALQLSGHTHGGQIVGLHLLAQWMNEGYVSGLYDVAGMPLYVSNGAGLWSGFPLRLGRPAEITQIVLRRAD